MLAGNILAANKICVGCIAGHKCPRGASEPTECLAGTYAEANSPDCLTCELGKYSPKGAANCTECTPGHKCPRGASEPTECLAGTYAKANSPDCLPCDLGTYNPKSKSPSCFPCPPGTYQDAKGAVCIKCPLNTFNPSNASTALSQCKKCNTEICSKYSNSIKWCNIRQEMRMQRRRNKCKQWIFLNPSQKTDICLPCPLGGLCKCKYIYFDYRNVARILAFS